MAFDLHRIYYRPVAASGFVGFGWFCENCYLFDMDDIIKASLDRQMKIKYRNNPKLLELFLNFPDNPNGHHGGRRMNKDHFIECAKMRGIQ